MLIERQCAQCGAPIHKCASAVHRADSIGAPLYCDRKCAGLARRREVPLSEAERKERKRLYDAQRRIELADSIKEEKAAYHKRTYDPVKAAALRKERMHLHVAYCRRPEYKAWKSAYDRRLRANEYEEFSESYTVLLDLEKEIDARADRYDVYMQKGTINKAQTRKRALL